MFLHIAFCFEMCKFVAKSGKDKYLIMLCFATCNQFCTLPGISMIHRPYGIHPRVWGAHVASIPRRRGVCPLAPTGRRDVCTRHCSCSFVALYVGGASCSVCNSISLRGGTEQRIGAGGAMHLGCNAEVASPPYGERAEGHCRFLQI